MRNIAIFLLVSLPLCAGFFPQTVQSTVSKVTKDSVVLKKPFPLNGMSGVVIHRYSDELQAITHRVIHLSASHAVLLKGEIIAHDSLPSINTAVKPGDRVIGGYLYSNVLLLAPDAKTYANITARYQRNWIHPDIFALFLADEGESIPTRENLSKFAKTYQVGLIAMVGKNSIKLYDPVSAKVIKTKTIKGLPSKTKAPFYMRFDKIESGWFSKNSEADYYSIIKRFQDAE